MRIALVTAYYSEDNGGNEYYLAKELSKKGNEVFIYVSKFTPYRFGLKKTKSGSKLKNVHVIRLESLGIKKIGMLYLHGLEKRLKEDKIDAVHVQEWFMPLAISCRKHKNLTMTGRLGNKDRVNLLFKIYCKLFSLFFNKKTTKFSALTSEAKELFSELANIDENKIKIIANGVDTNVFKPTKSDFRKKYLPKNKKDAFVILAIGRLHKEKGFDVLIKACSRLDFDFVLVIIGKGDEKEYLENLAKEHFIEDKIVFIERYEHDKLPDVYSSSDVVGIPSLNEPFGFVTLEAMACGIPVIGSDIGGMKDVITKDVGFKVSPGKIVELRNALNKVHKSKTRDKLKKGTINHIKKNYSWRISAQKYLNLYKEQTNQ
jgi:glycosyltransferase involved in cell wall biosynthesis